MEERVDVVFEKDGGELAEIHAAFFVGAEFFAQGGEERLVRAFEDVGAV